jgi:hypothetical protein
MPIAQTALSSAFYLLHTVVGNGAKNKLGSCCQWRNELLGLFSFISRWNSHYGNCTMMPVTPLRPCSANTRFSYPYGTMNFMAALAIRFIIANSCTRWRGILKGSHAQDGGRLDFVKNFLFSLYNKYLSNEPNFSLIHLAGQYI